jgi:restriction endonuclease Mrr
VSEDATAEREILDDISGFEFEELMRDVFRQMGYKDVVVAQRTADKGKDIIMREPTGDGSEREVVVECKHTDTVSRPVVQKLHSAASTHGYDGGKKGIVVTSGRFTGPAEEYAKEVNEGPGGPEVELIDGEDLREVGDEIGLDLYTGKVEVVCERALPVPDRPGVSSVLAEQFEDVRNLSFGDGELDGRDVTVELQPVIRASAEVNAVFETSVGVIHSVNETETVVLGCEMGGTEALGGEPRRMVDRKIGDSVELDEERLEEEFEEVERKHFGKTRSYYQDWVKDRLRRKHTTTVRYTGDNNVTYTKECAPSGSDVRVREAEPVYVPRFETTTRAGEYSYPYVFLSAYPETAELEDGIHRCVHCGDEDGTFTFCENCGSISCGGHTETERLEGEPVCTGCAVTERFFLRKRYFYDEENLGEFRRRYDEMPLHRKALENKPLVAAVVVLLVLGLGYLVSNPSVVGL